MRITYAPPPTPRMPWGSAADGDLDFTVDTTLAAGQNFIMGRNVRVRAGVKVLPHASDRGIYVRCSGTLTMDAAAQITPWLGVRSAGGNDPLTKGGRGGYSGRPAGFVWGVVNNVDMHASAIFGGGEDGENGQPGTNPASGNRAGTEGDAATWADPSNAAHFRGVTVGTSLPVHSVFSGGGDQGIGGVAGAGVILATYSAFTWERILRDLNQYIFNTALGPTLGSFPPDLMWWDVAGNPGGTQGYHNCNNGGKCPGGGSPGTAGFFVDGLTGVDSGLVSPAVGSTVAAGGGSGGVGAHGPFVCLVVNGRVISPGILSGKGGNGGNGGDAFGDGTSQASAGAPGHGGHGGALFYWGPRWGGTATVAGGTKGAKGNPVGGAPQSGAASDGTAGYKYMTEDS